MSDPLSRLQDALASENLFEVSKEARALVNSAPDLNVRWGEVANAALTAGDDLTALAAARKLAEAAPDHAESWLWVASVHAAMGEPSQALHVMESRARQFPANGAIQRRMGRALLEMGQKSRAQACYLAALKIDNRDSLAWEGLARARRFERGDEHLAVMEDLRIGWPEGTPAEQRGVLSYALAKAYEDLGEYEAAGRRVAEGAAFYREVAQFDVARHEAGIEHILNIYGSGFAEANDESGMLDSRPVFILAPPRAGAQWLASVLAADEKTAHLERGNGVFWAACAPLGDHTPEDILRAFKAGGANTLSDVGRTYLERVTEIAGRDATRVIDPSSLLEICGAAAGLCLPAAKFVRITREPHDVAWSIYRHRFAKGRFWSYHPDDIARVLAGHNRLCDRWAELFADRVLTIAYEDLAADPKDAVSKVARFIGVDADAAGAEAWLRADAFTDDPVGVHQRAGSRFESVAAALGRAGLV